MSTRNVGVKLGRGLGFIAATAWKGTVILAEATGELGEGVMEGAECGWEDRCKAMDDNRAAKKAKQAALIASMKAEQAAGAAPMVAA